MRQAVRALSWWVVVSTTALSISATSCSTPDRSSGRKPSTVTTRPDTRTTEPQKPFTTLDLTTQKAKKGSHEAQAALGLMYWKGEGVKQDVREAGRWFRLAAEGGDKWGQYDLGVYYDAYVNDYQTAARWYRKASEQGIAQAQDRLGAMYATGKGVERSSPEAEFWFQKAAAQGVTKEQDRLHRLGAYPRPARQTQPEGSLVVVGQPQQRSEFPNQVTQVGAVYSLDTQPTPAPRQRRIRIHWARGTGEDYDGEGAGHWIESVMDDGSVIKLEDDSLWQISPDDVGDSALWLPTSDIAVIEGDDSEFPYKLINKDDSEVVNARLLDQ